MDWTEVVLVVGERTRACIVAIVLSQVVDVILGRRVLSDRCDLCRDYRIRRGEERIAYIFILDISSLLERGIASGAP